VQKSFLKKHCCIVVFIAVADAVAQLLNLLTKYFMASNGKIVAKILQKNKAR